MCPWKTLVHIALLVLLVAIYWSCGVLLEYYVLENRASTNLVIGGFFFGFVFFAFSMVLFLLGYTIATALFWSPRGSMNSPSSLDA